MSQKDMPPCGLIGFGIFVGLVALVLYLFRGAPGRAERWKREMIARGERFTFAEVVSPFSPAAGKWELSLSNAASRLAESPHHPGTIYWMATNNDGFAPAVWRRKNPLSGVTSNFWPELAAQVSSNEAALAEVQALLASRPRAGMYDPARPLYSRVHNLVARRSAAQGLAAAAVDALHRGRLDQAMARLTALIGFVGTDESSAESLSDQLVRASLAGLVLALTWEACQSPGLDDAQLAQLQRGWQQANLLTNLARATEMERAVGLAFFEFARTNQTGMHDLLLSFGYRPFAGRMLDAVHDYLWRHSWRDKDELLFLQSMQPIMGAARAVSTNDSYALFLARARESRAMVDAATDGRFAQVRHSLTLIASRNWETCLGLTWRHEALRRVTLSAIAVKRYQLRHGRLPESLQALVPQFLSGQPLDPMSRQPLRYRRLAENAFALYALGENQQDDGGVGDDIYWPRLALAEQE